MISLRFPILLLLLLIQGCMNRKDLTEEQVPVESFAVPVSDKNEHILETPTDSIYFDGSSVVFFTPRVEELNALLLDKSVRESVQQAVSDFTYYASLVSDSLQSSQIPVFFTDQRYIVFGQGSQQFEVDRNRSGSIIGMILYNEQEAPKVLPGMQTHLSLLASIADYFYDPQTNIMPLLNYFDGVDPQSLHIYSSHSDILNQTGNRVDPFYYLKFGNNLANRANKFSMSVFAYHKFLLDDSLVAIICRVPSHYDESSVKLYIWDRQVEMVLDEIELAENVWNDKWIMVKDSWITTDTALGNFSIVQRKKEARMENGKRTVIDSLYKWQWTGDEFIRLSTEDLSLINYPLKDWDSYQEPETPSEITIVDEDYVWLPLETGDLTWENVILALPKPYSIEKEPIENQLVSNQIDTLVTISQPHVKLKFYRSPENNVFINGVVSDASINFKKGLKIGVGKSEFAAVFEKLKPHSILPDLVKVSSKDQDRVISYYFQNDTLVRIELTNFIH